MPVPAVDDADVGRPARGGIVSRVDDPVDEGVVLDRHVRVAPEVDEPPAQPAVSYTDGSLRRRGALASLCPYRFVGCKEPPGCLTGSRVETAEVSTRNPIGDHEFQIPKGILKPRHSLFKGHRRREFFRFPGHINQLYVPSLAEKSQLGCDWVALIKVERALD